MQFRLFFVASIAAILATVCLPNAATAAGDNNTVNPAKAGGNLEVRMMAGSVKIVHVPGGRDIQIVRVGQFEKNSGYAWPDETGHRLVINMTGVGTDTFDAVIQSGDYRYTLPVVVTGRAVDLDKPIVCSKAHGGEPAVLKFPNTTNRLMKVDVFGPVSSQTIWVKPGKIGKMTVYSSEAFVVLSVEQGSRAKSNPATMMVAEFNARTGKLKVHQTVGPVGTVYKTVS